MANRMLPPSKRPHRQPDQPARPDLAARLRDIATASVDALAERAGLDPATIRAEILDAARLATQRTRQGRDEILDNILRPGEHPMPPGTNGIESVFSLLAQHDWSPMDDRKAETFHRIVEQAIDARLPGSAPVRGAVNGFAAIGQPREGDRIDREGGNLSFRGGGPILIIGISSPKPAEVAAIQSGPAHFGLIGLADSLVMTSVFGDTSFDSAYSWHKDRPDERRLPLDPGGPGERMIFALLTVEMVDIRTNIVRARRHGQCGPDFIRYAYGEIRRQASVSSDVIRREAELNRLYARYPDPVQLHAAAKVTMTLDA